MTNDDHGALNRSEKCVRCKMIQIEISFFVYNYTSHASNRCVFIAFLFRLNMGNSSAKTKKSYRIEEEMRRGSRPILPVFHVSMPTWTAADAANNLAALEGPPTRRVHFSDETVNNVPSSSAGADKVKTKVDSKVRGKYEFKKSIGKGRFSRVYLVESRLTKKPFAMKIAKGKEGKEIFETELSILSRIRHPNIIQLIETFETSGRFYMVLQLATGGDLFDRVVSHPEGRLAESSASRIITMVMDGVWYLHRLGITHRDLKLDNLLFYHPGPLSNILITDFVIANMRKDGRNELMQTLCGSPEYLAPEMLLRKPYSSAVDMWSIGVVTYIVLSGSFPFDDDSNKNQPSIKLYESIVKGEYSFAAELWKGISEYAKDFIKTLLVANPENRMTAMQAIEHPWIKNRIRHRQEEARPAVSSSSEENSYEDSNNYCSSDSLNLKYANRKRNKKITPHNQEILNKLTERLIAYHSPRPL